MDTGKGPLEKTSVVSRTISPCGSGRVPCGGCSCKETSIFCGLPPRGAEILREQKVINTYRTGQVLFYEGHPATGLYCLSSGRVKLYKSGRGGRQMILRIVEAGDVVGYRALFAEEPYMATAEALEDSRVCFLSRPSVLSLLNAAPNVSFELMKRLSRELGRAEQNVQDQGEKSVKARTAGVLLDLQKNHGRTLKNGDRIPLPLKRRDLAEMVGTTQESVIRCLSDFKKRGLIVIHGREFLIKDPQTLSRISA